MRQKRLRNQDHRVFLMPNLLSDSSSAHEYSARHGRPEDRSDDLYTYPHLRSSTAVCITPFRNAILEVYQLVLAISVFV